MLVRGTPHQPNLIFSVKSVRLSKEWLKHSSKAESMSQTKKMATYLAGMELAQKKVL
jgi:hypothetical protein